MEFKLKNASEYCLEKTVEISNLDDLKNCIAIAKDMVRDDWKKTSWHSDTWKNKDGICNCDRLDLVINFVEKTIIVRDDYIE